MSDTPMIISFDIRTAGGHHNRCHRWFRADRGRYGAKELIPQYTRLEIIGQIALDVDLFDKGTNAGWTSLGQGVQIPQAGRRVTRDNVLFGRINTMQ
jgi:hypothetical protein